MKNKLRSFILIFIISGLYSCGNIKRPGEGQGSGEDLASVIDKQNGPINESWKVDTLRSSPSNPQTTWIKTVVKHNLEATKLKDSNFLFVNLSLTIGQSYKLSINNDIPENNLLLFKKIAVLPGSEVYQSAILPVTSTLTLVKLAADSSTPLITISSSQQSYVKEVIDQDGTKMLELKFSFDLDFDYNNSEGKWYYRDYNI